MVDVTLQQFQDDTPPSMPTLPNRSMEKRPRPMSDNMGRNTIEPTSGVTGLDGDVAADQGPNSIGYLGRNSQVQWMRTLQRKLGESQDELLASYGDTKEAVARGPHTPRGRLQEINVAQPIEECYFYLDDTLVNNLGDVDPDFFTPAETAKHLFKAYQQAVHTPFRILDGHFEEQLRTYYDMVHLGTVKNICPRWEAKLNLVFAIGSYFSHLIGAILQVGDKSHHVYMSRAVHLLGFDNIANFTSSPNQSLIQATGLLSIYLLVTGYVNRAWHMIGISLRHAQAAGFHLKNEDPLADATETRYKAQIWWALHSAECILTSITGRPRVVHPQDCTVPLLTNLDLRTKGPIQALSNQTTPTSPVAKVGRLDTNEELTIMDMDKCLAAWTRLDVIQHKVLARLYSPRTVGRSWESIQTQISSLLMEMDEWAQDALATVTSGNPVVQGPDQTREKTLLFFYYQSARICVTRPCLCRLDRRVDNQGESSASFIQNTADACIQAALNISSGLPKHTSHRWMYGMGPWWSSIHIIMQAITVLLLELTQRTSNLSKDPLHIFAGVENLVQWLETLKAVDRVAENAYRLVCDMLRKYKRFAKDEVPVRWLADEAVGLSHHNANMFEENPSLTINSQHTQQYAPQPTLYPLQPNHHVYSGSGNEAAPSPNSVDDTFGGIQFGQMQYAPFFNSQFTTLFDRGMEDESDENRIADGWKTTLG
ncbi:hypothetical protein DE146DRAFT_54010 [Phaeosphaeria sp. MPI-PUGE-AT-0046c]|nr:hypothetical protein DE146DRAFT_54010 [Phaeosphaeria sp. MPI-PUGE-AT-0046c]